VVKIDPATEASFPWTDRETKLTSEKVAVQSDIYGAVRIQNHIGGQARNLATPLPARQIGKKIFATVSLSLLNYLFKKSARPPCRRQFHRRASIIAIGATS
jgi:hypothetical protein